MNLPDYLPREVFDDWAEYRQKDTSRRKWTDRMARAFLRECAALHEDGYDVVRCVDKAMQAGWLMPYGRDDCKRHRRTRETTVTDLRVVQASDEKTAKNGLQAARGALKRG